MLVQGVMSHSEQIFTLYLYFSDALEYCNRFKIFVCFKDFSPKVGITNAFFSFVLFCFFSVQYTTGSWNHTHHLHQTEYRVTHGESKFP